MALLGVAYRFDSEDTRNSPTLYLARHLLAKGCRITLHDPYVKPDDQNLERFGLTGHFTRDLGAALADAEILFFCTGHGAYKDGLRRDSGGWRRGRRAVVDGANLYRPRHFAEDAGWLCRYRARHGSRRRASSSISSSESSAPWSAASPTRCRGSSTS